MVYVSHKPSLILFSVPISSGKRLTPFQKKLEKIKEKGPAAVEEFHRKEKHRIRNIRLNSTDEQKQRNRQFVYSVISLILFDGSFFPIMN